MKSQGRGPRLRPSDGVWDWDVFVCVLLEVCFDGLSKNGSKRSSKMFKDSHEGSPL